MRTPVASYMTTLARMKLTAKAGDWSPYWSAAAVVSATTVEVWLDGIPPDPVRRSQLMPWLR